MIGKLLGPWRAAAIYLLLAIAYFGDPIAAGVGISGADLIYGFGAYRYLAPPGFVPSNYELDDQVVQFEPWRKFAREELAAGRFPWSNPYQCGGLPFVGNHQSALFYPTTWLFLVLPDNPASVLAALAKVTAAATGTFVFLRSFAILRWVSLLGGLGFGFGGFTICRLGWPHTNVSILLPWSLYFTRVLWRSRQSRVVGAAGLVVVVALQVFGGHMPTQFHIGLAMASFVVFLAAQHDRSAGRLARAASGAARISAAYVIGLLLAAVQLVPSVSYLLESDQFAKRVDRGITFTVSPRHLLTILVPNAFGNPRDGNHVPVISEKYIPPWGALDPLRERLTRHAHFVEPMGIYVGSIFPLAALVGWRARRLRGLYWWAVGVLAFGIILVGDIPLISESLRSLPGIRPLRNEMFNMVMGFATVVAGAIGLDNLFRRPPCHSAAIQVVNRVRIGIVCLLLLAAAMSAAAWTVGHSGIQLPDKARLPLAHLGWQLAAAAALFAGLGWCLAAYLRGRLPRSVFAILVGLFLAAELVRFGRGYNPSFDLSQRYPETPGLVALRAAGDGTTIFFGDALPPNLATAYRISDLGSYDALGYPDRERAIDDLVRGPDGRMCRVPDRAALAELKRRTGMRVRFLAAAADSPFAGVLRSSYPGMTMHDGPDLLIIDLARAPHAPHRTM